MNAANGATNARNWVERSDMRRADINQPISQMPEPDAEQLLKMLDAEMARTRTRRTGQPDTRTSFRVWSIVLIIVGAAFMFALLHFMLSQMTPPGGAQRQAPATAQG